MQRAPYYNHHTIGVKHGFFGAQGGVSTGLYDSLNCGIGSDDDPQLIRQNRALACHSLQLPADRLAGLYQCHSADIVTLTSLDQLTERPRADGLVSALPDIGLGILTADCCPLLFYDDHSHVIGACHAGWRGAAGGVIENTVSAMVALGASPATITVLIGPTIAKASYQVGADMRAKARESAPFAEAYFSPDPNDETKYLFDLPAFAAACAERARIGQIIDLGLDTYPAKASGGFFSHRRATHQGERDTGRQIAIITSTR